MDGPIIAVWWVGLIGALPLTLVILSLSARVIGALGDILKLGKITRVAALDISTNLAAAPQLGALVDAHELGDAAEAHSKAAISLAAKISSQGGKA
ncbi:MAG: hypothetical protein H0W86_00875 [Armatimonadetes bacterium]|nr:hypothetical protein [Armatimonadota bacterium]